MVEIQRLRRLGSRESSFRKQSGGPKQTGIPGSGSLVSSKFASASSSSKSTSSPACIKRSSLATGSASVISPDMTSMEANVLSTSSKKLQLLSATPLVEGAAGDALPPMALTKSGSDQCSLRRVFSYSYVPESNRTPPAPHNRRASVMVPTSPQIVRRSIATNSGASTEGAAARAPAAGSTRGQALLHDDGFKILQRLLDVSNNVRIVK